MSSNVRNTRHKPEQHIRSSLFLRRLPRYFFFVVADLQLKFMLTRASPTGAWGSFLLFHTLFLLIATVAVKLTPALAVGITTINNEEPTLRTHVLPPTTVTMYNFTTSRRSSGSELNTLTTSTSATSPPARLQVGTVSRHIEGGKSITIELDLSTEMMLGTIMVGTPPQKYIVDFDTGSSTLWLFGTGSKPVLDIAAELRCDRKRGTEFVHTYYKKADSESYKPLTDASGETAPFDIEYCDGDIFLGEYAREAVQIGTHRLENVALGIANKIESLESSSTAYDGLFGLGLEAVHETVPSSSLTPPFIDMADSDVFGEEKLFSLYISRDGQDGELLLGGINEERFSGSLMYAPRWSKLEAIIAAAEEGEDSEEEEQVEEWVVSVDLVMFGHSMILDETRLQALVDSGASDIFGPAGAVNNMIREIEHRLRKTLSQPRNPPEDQNYYLSARWCNSRELKNLPDLTFTINGEVYTLEYRDYFKLEKGVCVLKVVPIEFLKKYWTLGQPFLEKYYTVFDYGNDRIGFARSKQQPQQL